MSEDRAAYVDHSVDFERHDLGEGTWLDVARAWVPDAAPVYRHLVDHVDWRAARLWRYERWVEEPRLSAGFGPARPVPHPALVEAQRALQARYRVEFGGVGLAYYRDGRDSVAFHRDRDMRWCEDTVIAILTFGIRRPWLLRRKGKRDRFLDPAGAADFDVAPGPGDLLVMGGRAQVDWEHSVPKVPGVRDGRISAQWRWTSKRGRPEVGPSYRAPRTFARSQAPGPR